MLLVDDDEPEVGHRCEHRRARAEHDARLAAEGVAPGARGARASVSAECSTASGAAKRSRKRPSELRREPDLGHQHQRARARREHALDEPQVHLGLAAAGDPVQHEGGEARRARRRSAATASALLARRAAGPGVRARGGGCGARRRPTSVLATPAAREPARARPRARPGRRVEAGDATRRRCRRAARAARAAAAPGAARRARGLRRPRRSRPSAPRVARARRAQRAAPCGSALATTSPRGWW